MEFLIRWANYKRKDDSYISWEAAEHLEELDKYMRKQAETFESVFGDAKRTGVKVWCGLEKEESDLVDTFLMRTKVNSTWREHTKHWGTWIRFLGYEHREQRWGVCLEKCTTEDEKVQTVIYFMAWLHAHPRNCRGEAVLKPSRAIRIMLTRHGFNTTWMDDDRIKEARKAAQLTNEEFREKGRAEDPKDNDFLPLSFDMLKPLTLKNWRDNLWNVNAIDAKSIDLSLRLGLDSGLRVGHVASTSTSDPNSDHRLKLEDVVFVETRGELKKWDDYPLGNFGIHSNREKILEITFYVWTSKSGKARRAGLEKKRLGRNSLEEAQLLMDLLLWWHHAGTKLKDPIFTRYNGKRRKELIAKNIRENIKAIADKWNLPQARMSTKSMRIGFASGSNHLNIDPEIMKERGGWSKHSNVPRKHYTKGTERGGLLAWNKDSSQFSVDHVRDLM